tara:strand:+ start:53 stop:469 length:417 start_codon:yes stop_codon:yes gene_type:complete
VTGWLVDTIPRNVVLVMTSISDETCFFLLASPLDSIWIVYLLVVLFDIVETGGSNNRAIFEDYFGRKSYGRLRGFTQLASSPRVPLAPVFAGWWYDRVESYTFPHWIFTVLIGLGALSLVVMRKPNRLQRATQEALAD